MKNSLTGKGEESSRSSTHLGILSHEPIVQVIAFIPATLRMGKTNRESERGAREISTRQSIWELHEIIRRQNVTRGHTSSLGRKDRSPLSEPAFSHGSDRNPEDITRGRAPVALSLQH